MHIMLTLPLAFCKKCSMPETGNIDRDLTCRTYAFFQVSVVLSLDLDRSQLLAEEHYLQ